MKCFAILLADFFMHAYFQERAYYRENTVDSKQWSIDVEQLFCLHLMSHRSPSKLGLLIQGL